MFQLPSDIEWQQPGVATSLRAIVGRGRQLVECCIVAFAARHSIDSLRP